MYCEGENIGLISQFRPLEISFPYGAHTVDAINFLTLSAFFIV
jgi:hypothetical protein